MRLLPRKKSDCLEFRLPENVSGQVKQTTEVITCGSGGSQASEFNTEYIRSR